jgi:hypothetical protein
MDNMDIIINPRKQEAPKDLHIYLTKELYNVLHEFVTKEGITKTDYVCSLIEKDLKLRKLL